MYRHPKTNEVITYYVNSKNNSVPEIMKIFDLSKQEVHTIINKWLDPIRDRELNEKRTECTAKIQRIRGGNFIDEDICEKIGISKPTFYSRLKLSNWKKSEVHLIESL